MLLGLAEKDLAQGSDGLLLVLAGSGLAERSGLFCSPGERALLVELWGRAADWPLHVAAGIDALGLLREFGPRRGSLTVGIEPWRGWQQGQSPTSSQWSDLAAFLGPPRALGRPGPAAQANRGDEGRPQTGMPAVLLSTLEAEFAGASAEQALASLLLMLEASAGNLARAGVSIQALPGTIGFELALGTDVFVHLPKLRALRRLVAVWWQLYTPGSPTWVAHLRGVSSGRELDRRDPWNNLLRSTYQAMAGVFGGVDVLVVPPFDQPLGQRGSLGQRLARNLHTLLSEESRLGVVADPAGGSYALEARTESLCQQAWDRYQSLRSTAGAEAALLAPATQAGSLQSEIQATRAQQQRLLATRRRVRVGVNDFVSREAREKPPSKAVNPRLAPDTSGRDGAPFEALAQGAPTGGGEPAVFLLNLGRQRDHHARASFMDTLLAVGGIQAVHGSGAGGRRASEAIEELWGEFEHSGLTQAIICGQDEETRSCLPLLLARKQPGQGLFLAGRFEELETWRAAGLDGGFHLGQDALQFLGLLLARLGLQGAKTL
jgi:methylmalonyl-CoA mutase